MAQRGTGPARMLARRSRSAPATKAGESIPGWHSRSVSIDNHSHRGPFSLESMVWWEASSTARRFRTLQVFVSSLVPMRTAPPMLDATMERIRSGCPRPSTMPGRTIFCRVGGQSLRIPASGLRLDSQGAGAYESGSRPCLPARGVEIALKFCVITDLPSPCDMSFFASRREQYTACGMAISLSCNPSCHHRRSLAVPPTGWYGTCLEKPIYDARGPRILLAVGSDKLGPVG